MTTDSDIPSRFRAYLNQGETPLFRRDEDYYFVLGQLLVHVFTLMGGLNRYRKEFNYLTNPSMSYPVQKLNQRIVHFLGRARSVVPLGREAAVTLDSVLSWQPGHQDESRHIENLEDAFYSGIHSENLLNVPSEDG